MGFFEPPYSGVKRGVKLIGFETLRYNKFKIENRLQKSQPLIAEPSQKQKSNFLPPHF